MLSSHTIKLQLLEIFGKSYQYCSYATQSLILIGDPNLIDINGPGKCT